MDEDKVRESHNFEGNSKPGLITNKDVRENAFFFKKCANQVYMINILFVNANMEDE